MSYMLQRCIHLLFVLLLIFMPNRKRSQKANHWKTAINWVLLILSLVAMGFIVVDFDRIGSRDPYVGEVFTADIVLGIITIILVLEATRRTSGWPLVLVSVTALVYAVLGPWLPGGLGHRGLSLKKIANIMYLSPDGIFGIPLGASATFIFVFILYGAFLSCTGTGKFIIDFAMAIAGRARGGPAKVSTVASGLFGTISGSAVANVYGTGVFTIPMMKNLGFKPKFAGAVESVASTGGQIMPPVMGAAAFIMAELTGIPYLTVCKAAFLPACFYYIALFFAIDFEAAKIGLTGLTKEETPPLVKVLQSGGHMMLSVVALITILILGYSPFMAAFLTIFITIGLSFLRKQTRMALPNMLESLQMGAENALMIASACACVGIVIGVATYTGLALKFTSMVVSIAKGMLFLALGICMITSIMLGMGLPTSTAYIMVAALGVPALTSLGVSTLAANMFVFYYACLSAITPPVAMAAYAGASLAGSGMLGTALTASRLGLVGFIVPWIFVFSPILLLKGGTILDYFSCIIGGVLGCISLSAGLIGWLRDKNGIIERILLVIAAICLVYPEFSSTLIGLLLLGAVYLRKSLGSSRKRGSGNKKIMKKTQ